jgi:hypothetical protein
MPNVEALQQLRRVMEAAPDDRIHMNSFSERAACGTAYCAAGWAAVDPWFQQNTAIPEIFAVNEDGTLSQRIGDAFGALANVFDIYNDEADILFAAESGDIDDHAITKAEVINNIDALIAGGEPEVYDAILYARDDEDDEWEDEDVDDEEDES